VCVSVCLLPIGFCNGAEDQTALLTLGNNAVIHLSQLHGTNSRAVEDAHTDAHTHDVIIDALTHLCRFGCNSVLSLSVATAASSSYHIEKLLRCGALQKLIILDRRAVDTIDREADAGSGDVSLASAGEAVSFQESARKLAYGIRTAVGVQTGADDDDSVNEAAGVGNGIPMGTLCADDLSKEDLLIDVQTTVKEEGSNNDNSDGRDDDNKSSRSKKRFRALVSKFWLQRYTPSSSH
jgi:hypothetical protein